MADEVHKVLRSGLGFENLATLAKITLGTSAFFVHNLAKSISARNSAASRPKLVVETATAIRRAQLLDVLQICALVNRYAAEKLMLSRTTEQVALKLDNYAVASDTDGRVLACAAIYEYSPSVAEVASVAVDAMMFGNGLGTQPVLAAERIAAGRGETRGAHPEIEYAATAISAG
jgi:hypothetical protein